MAKKIIKENPARLCRARPCMIITTLHENGILNAGTFGAYTNAGPNEIAVAIGVASHTYANIKRAGEFVVNIPHMGMAQALEDCARNIPETESELVHAGLTAGAPTEIKTPLIAECIANIECEFWNEIEMGAHSLVLGKALCGHLEEDFEDIDGCIDVIKAQVPFVVRYPEPLYARLDGTVKVRK